MGKGYGISVWPANLVAGVFISDAVDFPVFAATFSSPPDSDIP
jgi:hypothetical protein